MAQKKEEIHFIKCEAIEDLEPGITLDRAVLQTLMAGDQVIKHYSTDPKDALDVIKKMDKYCCCFNISVDLEAQGFDVSYVLRHPKTMETYPANHVRSKLPTCFENFAEGVCKTALIAVQEFHRHFPKEKSPKSEKCVPSR